MYIFQQNCLKDTVDKTKKYEWNAHTCIWTQGNMHGVWIIEILKLKVLQLSSIQQNSICLLIYAQDYSEILDLTLKSNITFSYSLFTLLGENLHIFMLSCSLDILVIFFFNLVAIAQQVQIIVHKNEGVHEKNSDSNKQSGIFLLP